MSRRLIRRMVITGLLAAVMLLICGIAAAEGNIPANPYQQEVWELDRLMNQLTRPGTRATLWGVTINPVDGHEPALGQTGQWTITLDSTLAEKAITKVNVNLQTIDPDGDYSTIYKIGNAMDGVFESCEFVAAGSYRIIAFYYFSDGTSNAGYLDFTLAEDGTYPSLQGRAAQIASECQVAGNAWQTALNLHDWLTMNARYDGNYEYYGADGVLLRGYGVCDSYSKAYVLLCQAAGIPVSRVTGNAGGGAHAWNAIQLDGEWYLVDATWDDPLVEGTAVVSGAEHHNYFCLNDELMSLDHTNTSSFSEPCTSLDANWLLRSGDYNEMGDNVTYNGNDSYSKRILEQLNGGETSFTVDCESTFYIFINVSGSGYSYYSYGTGSADAIRGWTLLAAALSRAPMTLNNGEEVNVSVTYNAGGNQFVCELQGDNTISGTCGENVTWVFGEDGTLTISGTGSMYNYDSEWDGPWFDYRDQVRTIVIEDGVTAIGECAFYRHTQVQTVRMADSVTLIGEGAFRGNTALTDIQFSSGLVTIGDYAFEECEALSAVTLPDGLETIGSEAFLFCNLSEIAVPAGTATRTWDLFYSSMDGEDYLCHLTLPESVTIVEFGAFCENPIPHDLPDFILPEDLTTIEAEAFSGSSPRFVWLQGWVTTIGSNAFASCENLEYVYIPFGCEFIGENAFPAGTKILGLRIDDLEPCAAQIYAEQNGLTFIELEAPFSGNG